MGAAVATVLYVVLVYYVSGYYAYRAYSPTLTLAFAFYPFSPRPVLNGVFAGLAAATGGILAWSWASRRLFLAAPACSAGFACLLPGLPLCCSPLLLFLATTMGVFGSFVLGAFRELTIALSLLQVLMIKAVFDITRRPEIPGLRAALARKGNVLFLLLLVEIGLAYELWLSSAFPYLL